MVIKLGKVLKNPFKVYPKATQHEAYAMCAYNIAMSYQHVPDWSPILGPFVQKLRDLSLEHFQTNRVLIEGFDYKVRVVPNVVTGQTFPSKILNAPPRLLPDDNPNFPRCDRFHVVDMVCNRYGLTQEEIEECESLIRSITELPCYIQHFVFVKLQITDYC
jgi:hypothetical protein